MVDIRQEIKTGIVKADLKKTRPPNTAYRSGGVRQKKRRYAKIVTPNNANRKRVTVKSAARPRLE